MLGLRRDNVRTAVGHLSSRRKDQIRGLCNDYDENASDYTLSQQTNKADPKGKSM